MADLNFPANPNPGDTYSIGSRTWVWNGSAWQLQTAIQNLDPFTVNRLVVTTTTNAVDSTSGAAVIAGGVGIGGDTYIDGNLTVAGTINAQISGTITTATNIAGGSTGSLVYQSSAGVTTTLPIGTDNQVLVVNSGTMTPTWINFGSLTSTTATEALNVFVNDVSNTASSFYLLLSDQYGNFAPVNAAGNLTFNPNTGALSSDVVKITSSATSIDSSSGALQVTGGVGIGGDVNITGNLNVTGTINAQISGVITTATNLAGGLVDEIPFQIADGGTSFSTTFKYNDSNKRLIVSNAAIYGDTATAYGESSSTTVSIEAGSGYSIQLFSNVVSQLNYGNLNTISVDSFGAKLLAGSSFLTLDPSGFVTITGLAQDASSIGYGALRIQNGGVYVGDNVYAVNNVSGGTLTGRNLTNGRIPYTSSGNLTDSANLLFDGDRILVTALEVTNTSTFQGTVLVKSTATSNTTTNGALVVDGGVGILENLNIGGTLRVTGPTTFSSPVTFSGTATYVYSTNTVYTDNILELHTPEAGINAPWTYDDGKDIGFRFHYFNRTVNTSSHAALVLANDTQWLEWYNLGAESNSGTFAGASYGSFKTGQIWAADTTNATTSTNSGALQVNGGASITQDLWVGGNIYRGGNAIVTQDQLFTATVTAISAGPGIAVTTSSGVVTITNTATLQFVTNLGASTTNAIQINNATTSTSANSGALTVLGGVGIGDSLYVNGNIVGAYSFIETTAAAGTNSTANWWTRVLSFTLPNVGDSTTFKVRTNAKVLSSVTASDNSDSDYVYITYVRSSASAVLGSITLGNENSGASSSFSVANHTLTFSTSTGYFEYWRRAPIANARIYARLEEVLPAGVRPTLFTTSTWAASPPQLGTSSTAVLRTPGAFTAIQASAAAFTSGAVGLSVTSAANIGTNSTGATINIANGVGTSTKVVNIATFGAAGSVGTITIGSANTGTLERFVVNTTVTQFTSTAQSISTTTGAIVINGGLGVGRSLYASEIYDNNNRVITNVEPTAGTGINIASLSTSGSIASFTVENAGVTSLTAGTDTVVTTATGSVTIWNNSTLQTVTDRGSTTTNTIRITNTTSATSFQTGALIVDGGVGVAGDLWIGGTLYSGGQAVLTTSSFGNSISAGEDITITELSSGTISISSTATLQSVTNRGATTTNAITIINANNSTSTTTGALTVIGGVGIGGQLNVSGTTSTFAGGIMVGTPTIVPNWKFYVSGNAYISSDFSAATLSGSVSLGHNQTTGNWIAGGDRQTGIITLGRSTLTQVVSIANGAAATGYTKTVNIGTEGLSSSTTLVNIGTSNTGSTSTINLNGNIVIASGSRNTPAWTTNGIAIVQSVGTWTDATSTGTVSSVAMNNFAAQTLAASNPITVSSLYGSYFRDPIAGTNVTATARAAIAADSIYCVGALTASGSTTLVATTVNGTFTVNGTLSLVGAGSGTAVAQFATGPTASGNVKTVNIGTGALAGSTTIINVGATASTSTIILNGSVNVATLNGSNATVTTATVSNLTVNKVVANPTPTTVDTTPVTIDSFSINEYRSAKYFISISNTATSLYQTTEIWLVQDGTAAHIEQTSVFSSGTNVVAFTTDVTAGVVSLIALGSNPGNRIKVQSTYITV